MLLSVGAASKIFPSNTCATSGTVGVGTGTVINRPAIKDYQEAMRVRAGEKISGGKIIKVRGSVCIRLKRE